LEKGLRITESTFIERTVYRLISTYTTYVTYLHMSDQQISRPSRRDDPTFFILSKILQQSDIIGP
jgi:hypothetical protein